MGQSNRRRSGDCCVSAGQRLGEGKQWLLPADQCRLRSHIFKPSPSGHLFGTPPAGAASCREGWLDSRRPGESLAGIVERGLSENCHCHLTAARLAGSLRTVVLADEPRPAGQQMADRAGLGHDCELGGGGGRATGRRLLRLLAGSSARPGRLLILPPPVLIREPKLRSERNKWLPAASQPTSQPALGGPPLWHIN